MPDVLARIVAHERRRVEAARARLPVSELRRAPGWNVARHSLAAALHARRPAIIAECKRRSPSRGVLREPYDPVSIAAGYAAAGAAAISVLTNEEFFGGTLADLVAVRAAVELPVLRKDFVCDPYQLEEARAAGADAVLLIAAVLGREGLGRLAEEAAALGLEALIEVHDEAELEMAAACDSPLLGINNRDLRTFTTDLATSERLARLAPPGKVVIAESGLRDAADLERLARAGIGAFLVGEGFMVAPEPGEALRTMLGGGVEASAR